MKFCREMLTYLQGFYAYSIDFFYKFLKELW